MGVDSGLGTFRGINAASWQPLKAMGMEFPRMSTPRWFHNDPQLAWAFWTWRFSPDSSSKNARGGEGPYL